MKCFLETVETIEEGAGFAYFGATHLVWLAMGLLIIALCCLWYPRLSLTGKTGGGKQLRHYYFLMNCSKW